MFEVNLPTFLGLTDNFDGGYSKRNDSNEITGKELLSLAQGGTGGIYAKSFPGGLPAVLMSNFKRNWFMMGAQVVGIPIAAKMISRAIRKPIINPVNRTLKSAGITGVKV
jgi:hypothetical protein